VNCIVEIIGWFPTYSNLSGAVYPLPESLEISEEYASRALPVLRKRLVQSGLRLARLLNDTLKKYENLRGIHDGDGG
jgi:hypothetical protein